MRGKDKHATIVGEADGSEVIGKKTDSISPHYELSPICGYRKIGLGVCYPNKCFRSQEANRLFTIDGCVMITNEGG